MFSHPSKEEVLFASKEENIFQSRRWAGAGWELCF